MASAPMTMEKNEKYDVTAEYDVTVHASQSTTFTFVNGSFGDIRVGTNKTISPTFYLTNNGTSDAFVFAKFETHKGRTYGLKSSPPPQVIPASNFKLGRTDGNMTALYDNGTDVQLAGTVPHNGTAYNYTAELYVPREQKPGEYDGTVQLTFANA